VAGEQVLANVHSPSFPSVTCAERLSHGILEAVSRKDQNGFVDWDRGREGYLNVPQKPVYAPVSKSSSASGNNGSWLSIRAEERAGSLIAAAGTIWAVYAATHDYTNLWHFQIFQPGPVEVCALGILLWLHAKWRRSGKAG
jgi:hypothetical protein